MALTFDGPSKRIVLTSGTVSVGVRELWSRWADWLAVGDNSKYLPAFRSVGGDEINASDGTSIPLYAFLLNGWRVRPQEATHTLEVDDGVLLVDGGGDPFVNPTGIFAVRINYRNPVQAITVATGGGSGPSAAAIAAAVRAELAVELERIDTATSTRAETGVMVPADVRRVNGVALAGAGVPGDSMRPA